MRHDFCFHFSQRANEHCTFWSGVWSWNPFSANRFASFFFLGPCLCSLKHTWVLNRPASSKEGSVREALRAASSATWLGRCFSGCLARCIGGTHRLCTELIHPKWGSGRVVPLHHCKPTGRKVFCCGPSPLPPGSWHPALFPDVRVRVSLI